MATLNLKPVNTATQESPFQGTTPLATGNTTSVAGSQTAGTYRPVGDEMQIGLDYLGQALNSNNALMRNARTSGLEAAAARGLTNSSIAAGAAQRASLDAAMPLVQQSMGLFGDRENRNWQTGEREASQLWQTGERQDSQRWQTSERESSQNWQSGENSANRNWQSGENALSRSQQLMLANMQEESARAQREWAATQAQLDRDQQLTMAQVQDWMANEAFNRQFNAQLATMPINSTAQLLTTLAQAAIAEPEIYTPDYVSGMTEFFTTNFLSTMSNYFPNYFRAEGG